MRAKHARLIRYGIHLARMGPEAAAGPLSSWLLPNLTIRAYVREDVKVVRRMLHPNARCSFKPETADREQSTILGSDERTTG